MAAITIHDVAERAGVSIKTVSRVLNKEPNVRPATRQRVLEAVESLRYRPSVSARSLAGSRSFLIALFWDNPSPNYISDLQRGAVSRCREDGYHLVLEPLESATPVAPEITRGTLLTLRRDRLDRLIEVAGRALKGEVLMELNAFDMSEIEEAKAKYSDEARERWGDTDAYKQSTKRAAAYGKADWARVSAESKAVFEGFAKLVGTAPDSPEAKALVRRWQEVISRNFYDCTDEIMLGLASMYEADERFAENIDKAGEGTAKFMTAAIRACLG